MRMAPAIHRVARLVLARAQSAGPIALFAWIGLLYAASAQAENAEDQQLRVVCAATVAVAATQTEGAFAKTMGDEAQRHAALVTDQSQLETMVRTIQHAYTSGGVSRSRIVDLAESCNQL